ncbi:maleylpyruvate isomerase family mycothiol-dependent enzyme [Dactylosporangium matsuzakiense]|uniref:Maleylpyruvate isomerase n=1 Tax=Dactylosporangium matsuzakiense TaxID=53360 RepID=A0A9W6KHA7_9ACTN|nr:maleylpyruvate isomerase family mycothiol-dependent enzyme [Dactylosporangium matsuzakiense]UWZ46647.1 maleylpyruvate isomerase family mycothiol-dependent enzyme [Dactylosporangium matsuzakiense]GLL01218.1 maleylpyruvate isomerase [Dactylosporangium matsuzakiense]
MTADPLALNAELERATTRLLATLEDLDLTRPSLCPGWTRGHVVTHLARNADAYVNLLTWARTGVRTPAYASPAARDADIEAGAGRPAEVQRADLAAAATRLATAIDALPAESWSAVVALPSGTEIPAARLVWSRLCEVELHHVDLDAAYRPSDWPEAFSRRILHDPATPRAATLTTPDGTVLLAVADAPTVTGEVHALAAWLTGRSDGTDLTGDRPDLEAWK